MLAGVPFTRGQIFKNYDNDETCVCQADHHDSRNLAKSKGICGKTDASIMSTDKQVQFNTKNGGVNQETENQKMCLISNKRSGLVEVNSFDNGLSRLSAKSTVRMGS